MKTLIAGIICIALMGCMSPPANESPAEYSMRMQRSMMLLNFGSQMLNQQPSYNAYPRNTNCFRTGNSVNCQSY